MSITNTEVRRLSVIVFIISLIVLAFLILRPILISIATGLILSYVFIPLHKKIILIFKGRNLSAFIVIALIVLVILAPMWFLVPLAIEQAFGLFN